MDENVVKAIIKTIYDSTGAKEAQKDFEKLDSEAKNMSDKISTAFSGVKWSLLGQAISKISDKISDVTKKSADYIETLNVLQVAFDGNTQSIKKFADTLSDTLNLDDATIISAAAHFKVLSKSMGMATETGEKLSELMTKMTLDLSSLYNIDFDKAQTALQYAMEGRGTSLKQRTGVSVLETTVQTTLDTLGVDAYVEDMNDAEKALARVISMEYQLMSSQGDLARTIEAPANQMRVMGEQLQMLARNIGNVFLPIIAKVLPYLNAMLIVINAIISALARLVGYKEDMFDTFTDSNTIDYFNDVGGAIDGVGKSAEKTAKKLQGLRGFDKLNVIRTPQDSKAGGGAGGGAGGISPGLLDAFNKMADKYKMKLDEIETKATRIAKKILEWLGFVKKDGKWMFEKVKPGTVLAMIVTVAGLGLKIYQIYKFLNKIGLIKATWLTNLVKLFKDGAIAKNAGVFSKTIGTIAKALGMTTGELALAIAAFVAIGVAVVHAYNHIDEFKKKVDTAFSSVTTFYSTVINKFVKIADILKPILNTIIYIISQPFEQAWKNIETILGMMYDGIVGSFSTIADVINGFAKIITDIINLDIGKAFKDLKNMVKNIKEDWNTYWDKITKRFVEWKDDLLKKLESWKDTIIEKINEIPKKLEELPEKAGNAIGKMIKKIQDKIEKTDWEKLGANIIEGIKNGMLKKMPEVALKINLLPFYILTKIGELSGDLWTIGYNIMTAIGKGMSDFIWNGGLSGVLKSFVKGIKEGLGIHSPAKVILDAEIGDYSMEAIVLGMERKLNLVDKEAEKIVDTLNSGMKNATNNISYTSQMPNINDSFIDTENGKKILNKIGNNVLPNNSSLNSNYSNSSGINNATFIVQVGDEQIAKKVLKDLNGMAKSNGKVITIGG